MHGIKRTARPNGLPYLALAVTGMLGFLYVRGQLHVVGVPDETLANLVGREGLARLGIALELCIVLTQGLLAIWIFRLFRSVSVVAAGAIAAFGLMNAVYQVLSVPVTSGEFWILGYLLVLGVRTPSAPAATAPAVPSA